MVLQLGHFSREQTGTIERRFSRIPTYGGKMEQKVLFQREYVSLLQGDVHAALMLSQIVYWYRPSKKSGGAKLRVYKKGIWWLAKSHRHWHEECGLSRKQVHRCINALYHHGLIEKGRFRFDGSPTVHVRLRYASGRSVLTEIPSAAELEANAKPFAHKGNLDCAPKSSPLTQEEQFITESTTETTTASTGVSPMAHAKTGGVKSGVSSTKLENKIENFKAGKKLNADEILAKHKAARTSVYGDTGKKRTSLVFLWMRAIEDHYPETFQRPMRAKERGQFKHLEQAVGPQVRALIPFIVGEWKQFRKRVESGEGVKGTPSRPLLGFLLAHAATAMTLYLQSIAKPAPQGFVYPVPALPTPLVAIPVIEEDDPLPPDFFEKLLAELKPKDD